MLTLIVGYPCQWFEIISVAYIWTIGGPGLASATYPHVVLSAHQPRPTSVLRQNDCKLRLLQPCPSVPQENKSRPRRLLESPKIIEPDCIRICLSFSFIEIFGEIVENQVYRSGFPLRDFSWHLAGWKATSCCSACSRSPRPPLGLSAPVAPQGRADSTAARRLSWTRASHKNGEDNDGAAQSCC